MRLIQIAFNIIILSSSSLIGLIYSNRFRIRASNLLDLEYCIRILEGEILVTNNPLPEALERVYKQGKGDIRLVFKKIRNNLTLEKPNDLYSSFLAQEEELREKYCLQSRDIDVFFSLARVLGKTNSEDQAKNFKFAIDLIHNLAMEANREQVKNKKLYPSLGVLIGIMIIIIII